MLIYLLNGNILLMYRFIIKEKDNSLNNLVEMIKA